MTGKAELNDLDRRAAIIEEKRAEGFRNRRKKFAGDLSACERVVRLGKGGEVRLTNQFVGKSVYDGAELVDFQPSGLVEGIVKRPDKRFVFLANDSTLEGGAHSNATRGTLGQEPFAAQRALQMQLPLVRLLDAAGGSIKDMQALGRSFVPDGNAWTETDVKLLSIAPVASALMGSVAGLPAIEAMMSHFTVMVAGKSHLFPGGPPVVKAATGQEITKEELGGSALHTRTSGCIDNVVKSDLEAIEAVERFLSYLPENVFLVPGRLASSEEAGDSEDLLEIIPSNPRRPYDMRKLIGLVTDKDSFFEIAPHYGGSRITGLARVNGYPVGIIGNNPMINGGSTNASGGAKVTRLIRLCDTFHLPLISFADEPGFQVGKQSEEQGIERAGARLVSHVCMSRMPMCTIVVRQLFGVAGQCHQRPSGYFRRYAWPSARWGGLHVQGGAVAAYKREIESAEDPQAKRAEIERMLSAVSSPFRTAEVTGQTIIDPRETRNVLSDFVDESQNILAQQVGAPLVPYIP